MPALTWDDDRKPEFERAEPLGEGDSFECYLLDGRRVVRLARHAAASAALLRETILFPLLQKQVTVSIPQIDGSGTSPLSGERFVSYPLLSGAPLTPQILEGLGSGCRTELIRQTALFAAQIHSFPVELASAAGVPELNLREYLPALMHEAGGALGGRVEPDVWQYHLQLAQLYIRTPELQEYSPSLIHGDFSPDHLLAAPDDCRLTGVIDFSDCHISDPLWDFLYIRRHYGTAVLRRLLDSYPCADRQGAESRIRIYQELNNVQFCLSMHQVGENDALSGGIRTLTEQASGDGVFGDGQAPVPTTSSSVP